MSPHYKAFIVVIVMSLIAAVVYYQPMRQAVGPRQAANWRNMWLAATATLFLVSNFWLFIIAVMTMVAILARAEPLKPAVFAMLLFFAPAIGEAIPGFAGINKFIMVTPPIGLSLVLLIPLMLSRHAMKKVAPAGGAADIFFSLYLVLVMCLSVRAPSFTHMLRTAIEVWLAMAPIYYVFSRSPKTLDDLRLITGAYIFGALFLSFPAIPEFLRNWHLYNSASDQWFGARSFSYVMRDGYLRTSTSLLNSVVWGTLCMTAIGLGLAFFSDKFSKPYRYLSFALLGFGLIASFSRGPWVGAFITVAVFILVSPRAPMRVIQAGAGGVVLMLVSLATPFGRSVIDLLPFIGDSATDTLDYRTRLLVAARDVILENPLFGSANYLSHPLLQPLRQGQGIIDIVNSYLEIGLQSGLIGLGLFLGFFGFALKGLWGAIKSSKHRDPVMSLYCRAYFATIVGLLVTLFTTSSVLHIPVMTWLLGGMAVALTRVEKQRRLSETTTAEAPPVSRQYKDEPRQAAAAQFDWK